jgi:hypothetical protein
MDPDDIFFSRLKLMVLMGYAYLDGFALGERRREAMLENARHITLATADRCAVNCDEIAPATCAGPPEGAQYDHIFYQRVKLLAVMLTGVAKGFHMGEHRRTAMLENLERIRDTLMRTISFDEVPMIKVA